jgi:Mrp family chromosome partitioning ATPase
VRAVQRDGLRFDHGPEICSRRATVPRALHYVTGKGGVGKSVVAAALAVEAARRGARVLAVGRESSRAPTLRSRPTTAPRRSVST